MASTARHRAGSPAIDEDFNAASAAPSNDIAGPPAARRRPAAALAGLADGQLVTLALNGEQRAFSQLIARHGRKLRHIVGRRIPSRDEADEIVQDVLLSAWAALQTYPAARPFELWLICIALNKCRDWGRRRAVRLRAKPYLECAEPLSCPDAETVLMQDEQRRAFDRSLASLPRALREPLILTAVDGLPQKEAALLLGITPKGVETRVRRARLRLSAMAAC